MISELNHSITTGVTSNVLGGLAQHEPRGRSMLSVDDADGVFATGDPIGIEIKNIVNNDYTVYSDQAYAASISNTWDKVFPYCK